MRFVSTSYQRRRQQNRRYKEYDKDPAGSLLQLCKYVPPKSSNHAVATTITTTGSSATNNTQRNGTSLNSSSHTDTHDVDDVNELYDDIHYILQNYPSVIHTLDPRNGMNVLHYVCTNPTLINNLKLIQLLLTTSILQSNDSDYPQLDGDYYYNDDDNTTNNKTTIVQPSAPPNSPANKSDTSNGSRPDEQTSGLPIASVLLREKTSIKGQLALHLACSCCSGTVTNNSLALVTTMPVMEYLIQCHPSAVCIPDKIQQNLPIHEACNWIRLYDNATDRTTNAGGYIEILILLIQQWPEACQIPNRDGNIAVHLAIQRCLSLTTKPLTTVISSITSGTSGSAGNHRSSRSRKDGSSSSSSVSSSSASNVLAATQKRMESVELGILIDDLDDDASVYSCSHSTKTTKTSGSYTNNSSSSGRTHKHHPSPSGSDSHDSNKTGTTYTDSSSSDDDDDLDNNHKDNDDDYDDDDDSSFADDDSESRHRSNRSRSHNDDHHRSRRSRHHNNHNNTERKQHEKGSNSKSSSTTPNYYIDKLQQEELVNEKKFEKETNKAKIQSSLEIIQYLVNVYPAGLGVENKNGLTPYQLALAIMKSYGYSNLYTTRVSLASHSKSSSRSSNARPPSHSILEFLRRATKKYYNDNHNQERFGI